MPTANKRLIALCPGYVEERILSIPGIDFKLVSIGLVNFSSVSIAEVIGA